MSSGWPLSQFETEMPSLYGVLIIVLIKIIRINKTEPTALGIMKRKRKKKGGKYLK